MTFDAALAELLACPACGTRLAGASCLNCRIDFPEIGGIPWLMPEPRLALTEWRGRLHHLLTHYATEAARQRAALESAAPGLSRTRIEHLAGALEDQAVRIRELMHPLGIERRGEAHAVHVALGTALPISQGLTSYYPNLHRDWSWGDAENRASLDAVVASLPKGSAPSRRLVLGAGAGRLAYDLHQALTPGLTVALDFNPLFLLATARILAGPPLALHEFPIAPKSIADHAVLRQHAAPQPPRPGLSLVLADASATPFRPGQFDLVLTPWFIDVAGEPIERVMTRVNSLLAPGGLWINHGSLAFSGRRAFRCAQPRGTHRAPAGLGFSRPQASELKGPYLSSPASRRADRVRHHLLCAQRRGRPRRPGSRTAAVDRAY
jgi:uncharacterized protein YbaR (Trm112 family)